uniref:Uncharacterized protein n=1 Tax=Zea mays TaxID=4577 RepID=C4J817_MAIZE|nr:unknown [Zea mays]
MKPMKSSSRVLCLGCPGRIAARKPTTREILSMTRGFKEGLAGA